MLKRIYAPEPGLSACISHYMHLDIYIDEHDDGLICSFPRGGCMLHITISEDIPELRFQNGKILQLRSFLCGIVTHGIKVLNSGHFDCILVFLTPLGAYRLFQVPQSEYFNSFISPCCLDNNWKNVVEQIMEETSINRKIQLLNHYFKKKAISPEKKTAVESISRYIHRFSGKIKIDKVLSEFGITSRTLDRNFTYFLGLPPKPYANLVRLGYAYQMLMFQPQLSIHDIVYLLGYYDQSHLSKELAGYADILPSELKKGCSPKIILPRILNTEN